MTDADEIREQGQLIAGLAVRVEILEREMEKLRSKVHEIGNLTTPVVMGYPATVARTSALESRAMTIEMRTAILDGLLPRVEKLEHDVAAVKGTADGAQRTITTAGSVIGKFLDRFLLPILLALLIGWLAVHFGLK